MPVSAPSHQNIDFAFDDGFFDGTVSTGSSIVPGRAQVSIDGHPYIIEPKAYQRVTVPLRRESTDESVEPGEQTLNTGGAWRRSQDNWFMGAGQLYGDNRFAFVSVYTSSGESPSVRTRFWRSKGVDTFSEGALSLLPEQALKGASASSTQFLETVGSRVFWWDGTNLKVTSNPTVVSPTWTTITAPLSLGAWPTVLGMTTDGANLYLALGTYGVGMVASGSSTATILRPTGPTPTVTPQGTPGTTTYTYFIVATDANGFKSLVSASGQTTTGNATPNNLVTWAAVQGGVSYDVLRGDTAHWVALGVTNTSFTDTVASPTAGYTAPTNTTLTIDATFVGYGNGFLLAAAGSLLTQVDSNGMTTLVKQHFNPNFVWNACTGAPQAIYVSGYANGVSELYGIQLSTTTFALGAPYIAGQVSDGEIINALSYYQGVVVLSTSLGVRTAQDSNSNGFLTTGAVIMTNGTNVPTPSLCNAAWGNFVWYGLTDFQENDGIYGGTAASSGLGKLFLSEFSEPLIPAYTTDIMATNGITGATVAVTIFNGVPIFAIAGSGVWGPSGNLVSYGYIETGWWRYGTVEDKILVSTDVRHEALPAGAEVTVDVVPFAGQSFTALTSAAQGSIGPNGPVSAGNPVGEAFHVILQLNRGTTPTQGPVVSRWTARSIIIAARQDEIVVPIIWYDEVETPVADGSPFPMDLAGEWQFLKALETSGRAFIYQEGSQSYICQIDQIEMQQPDKWNDDKSMLQGILMVKLLTVA